MNINIVIAGRNYPINVSSGEEAVLRKVGKCIDTMIKEFETNFDVKDKQDVLAMCALKMGVDAEKSKLDVKNNIKLSNERILQLQKLLEEIGN